MEQILDVLNLGRKGNVWGAGGQAEESRVGGDQDQGKIPKYE